MFIQTEDTPNPAAMKFLPGRPVLETGVAEFTSLEAAASSPLARLLFDIDGVVGVFLGRDFITVTKTDQKSWQVLKPLILGSVMDHFTSGADVMESVEKTDVVEDEFHDDEVDDEVVVQIKELIETRVRPAVAQDGGDIIYRGFKKGTVYLQLRGSCAGCPSSTATLKMGIENMLRHYVPEVSQVEAVA
ncbi:MAG TPA: NifU family protein [Rhodospirillaceae bacterium]|nr:NifU family protein [Candidatus Neomarinimicrobiota bacterium]HCX13776.1 NifU family protein [Rhodospirillaceae bacterium]